MIKGKRLKLRKKKKKDFPQAFSEKMRGDWGSDQAGCQIAKGLGKKSGLPFGLKSMFSGLKRAVLGIIRQKSAILEMPTLFLSILSSLLIHSNLRLGVLDTP